MKPNKAFTLHRPQKARLKKMEADNLERETQEMEKKIEEMKLYMKDEKDKQFMGDTFTGGRFDATKQGPIRNYGAHIINKHIGGGKQENNKQDPKSKTMYKPKEQMRSVGDQIDAYGFEPKSLNKSNNSEYSENQSQKQFSTNTIELDKPVYYNALQQSPSIGMEKKSAETDSTKLSKNNLFNQEKTNGVSHTIGCDPINFDEDSQEINVNQNKSIGSDQGNYMVSKANSGQGIKKPGMIIRRDNSQKFELGMQIKPKPLSGRSDQLPQVPNSVRNVLSANNNNGSDPQLKKNGSDQQLFVGKEQQRIQDATIKPTSSDKVLKVSLLGKSEKQLTKSLNIQNNIDLLSSRIKARMDSDEREVENFQGELNLMRYYDRFWDAGFTSKDMLLNMGTEDLNRLLVPAGHQIKIDIELNKLKVAAGQATQEMCCGTDDLEEMMENNPNIVKASKPVSIFNRNNDESEKKKETYNPGKHIDDLIKKLESEQTENNKGKDQTSQAQNISKTGNKEKTPKSTKKSETISIGTDDINLMEEHLKNKKRKKSANKKQDNLYQTPKPKPLQIKHLTKKTGKRLTLHQDPNKKLESIVEEGEVDIEETYTQGDLPDYDRETPQLPFSLFAVGGTDWSNTFSILPEATTSKEFSCGTDPVDFDGYETDKIIEIPAKAGEKQMKADICFNCYKKLEKGDYHDHSLFKDRAFCSISCMNTSTKGYISTCEECYTLFEKTKGALSCGVWVCSDKCAATYAKNKGPSLRLNPESENIIKIHDNKENEKSFQDRKQKENSLIEKKKNDAKAREVAQLKKEIREAKTHKKKNESKPLPKKRDSLMMSQGDIINLNESSQKGLPKKGDIVLERSNYNLVEFQNESEGNTVNPDENFKIQKLEDVDLGFEEYESA